MVSWRAIRNAPRGCERLPRELSRPVCYMVRCGCSDSTTPDVARTGGSAIVSMDKRPFSRHRPVEPLNLAIGLRPIRTR